MDKEITVAIIEPTDPKQTAAVKTESEKQLILSVSDLATAIEQTVITTETEYAEAAQLGCDVKRRAAEVKEFFKPIKDAAHKAHKEVCDREKEVLAPLERAEKALKARMGAYAEQQERARRELEEQARQAARAEAERMLNEACELEANGLAYEADMALEEAQFAADTAQTMTLASVKPTAKGTYVKRDWMITGIDATKVPISLNGVEIRPVDKAAVMRLIRASKGTITIPGITYETTSNISFRK